MQVGFGSGPGSNLQIYGHGCGGSQGDVDRDRVLVAHSELPYLVGVIRYQAMDWESARYSIVCNACSSVPQLARNIRMGHRLF